MQKPPAHSNSHNDKAQEASPDSTENPVIHTSIHGSEDKSGEPSQTPKKEHPLSLPLNCPLSPPPKLPAVSGESYPLSRRELIGKLPMGTLGSWLIFKEDKGLAFGNMMFLMHGKVTAPTKIYGLWSFGNASFGMLGTGDTLNRSSFGNASFGMLGTGDTLNRSSIHDKMSPFCMKLRYAA